MVKDANHKLLEQSHKTQNQHQGYIVANMNCSTQHDPVSDNNRAVTLMESGGLEDAIHLLSRALETTKKALFAISEDEHRMCTSGSDMSSHDPLTLDLHMNMCSAASIIPEHGLSHVVSEDEQAYYIYCKAIQIEQRITCSSSSAQRRMVIYSTIIIFNLALAFHLSTITKSPQSSHKNKLARLTKALKLYELALSLQEQEQIKGNVFFTLATVNNMGVIQRSIGESDKQARDYFEFVLSNLLPVFAGMGKPNACPLTAFFRNAINVLNSRSHSAAAA